MDWLAVKASLVAWAALCSGLEAKFVRFEDEPRTMVSPITCELSVLSTKNPGGLDDTVWTVEATTTTPTTGGHRELLLQVAFDTDKQSLGGHPIGYAEAFRTAVMAPGSIEALSLTQFRLLGTTDVINVRGRDAAGRLFPRAIVEVRLGFVSLVTTAPIPFIASTSTTLETIDGDTVTSVAIESPEDP